MSVRLWTKLLSVWVQLQSLKNFRFGACFEQGVLWYSGNYRVWIHSETCTWHDKNIQSKLSWQQKEAYVDIFEIRKSINAGSGQESSIYIILTNETQQYIKMFNTKLSKLIYLPYHIFFWVVETYLFLNVVNFHYIFRQSF